MLLLTVKADGSPYPNSDVKAVKFLVYDATGTTVYVGAGVAGQDGWQIHRSPFLPM